MCELYSLLGLPPHRHWQKRVRLIVHAHSVLLEEVTSPMGQTPLTTY